MDLKDTLKDSKFEKYTENFNKKGIFTVEQYYKLKGSDILSEIIPDETERVHFGFFMTEKAIIEPSQNKPLPSAPRKDENTSSTKSNSLEPIETPEKIKDLIDFLKSNNDILIKINAHQECYAFFQLKSDVKSNDVQQAYTWDGDCFDLKKPVYEDEMYFWAEAEVVKDEFISNLQEFLDNNKGGDDLLWDDYFYDELIIDISQDPEDAIEIVSCVNQKYGEGLSEGDDDVSCFDWDSLELNRSELLISFFKINN